MTKNDYLKELEGYLKKLPAADFQEAMDYFTEYFDEAGPENEAQVIQDLGSPKEAANEILNTILDEKLQENSPSTKKHATIIWIAILAILASPITLPLLLTVLAVIITLIVLIITMLLTLFIFAFVAFASAFQFIIDGFGHFATTTAAGLLGVGTGLGLIGLSLLMILVGIELVRLFIWLIITVIRWIAKKGKRS